MIGLFHKIPLPPRPYCSDFRFLWRIGVGIINVWAGIIWKSCWFFCQSSEKSHCKPRCSRVGVGDVMSNLFKIKVTRTVMRISSLKQLCYDNCRRRKWRPGKCDNFIKSKFKILNAVLLWLLNMLRGIWAGDMHIYSIVWILLTAIICFSPTLPCSNQSRSQIFRQWIIMRGYVIYSPKKNKGNHASEVKIRLLIFPILSAPFSVCPRFPSFAQSMKSHC